MTPVTERPYPRRTLPDLIGTLVVCATMALASVVLANPQPLNVIVLLVDDWGWTDARCLGSDFYDTPNIDKLYAHSTSFDNAYSACTVCSPTRAALMTGMYPARLHLTNYIPGARQPAGPLKEPPWTERLEHRHVTIAEALRDSGYRTAHVGKWHLTPHDESLEAEYLPEKHGFELNIGGNRFGQPGSYFHPYASRRVSIGSLPPGGEQGDYLTDRLTDEAIALMRGWNSEPFFIHLAYYAVHTPIQPKPQLRDQYAARIDPAARHRNPGYAAMIQTVDDSVGRIVRSLTDLGIADRTMIILTSDNGGVAGRITSNAPLRSGKSHEFEGGVRVPLMVRWPGVAAEGRTCHEPVITMDLYPTILEAAKVNGDDSHNSNLDGVSLAPVLRHPSQSLGREALYWHYPHYQGTTPYGAVRSGAWRYVEYYEDGQTRLYNLETDIGETTDLAATHPDRAAELQDMLHKWREQVGAQMPTHVPGFATNEAAP